MRLVAFLILALSLTGCARLQPLLGEPIGVEPRTGDATSLRASVNGFADRLTATIHFADSRTTRADALHMGADSTSWLDAETRRPCTVATADVRRVSFQGRKLGAGEGVIGGFMIGVLSGAVVGSLAPGSSETWLNTRRDHAAFGALGFGLLGAAAGGLASAGSGRDVVFVFEPSAE